MSEPQLDPDFLVDGPGAAPASVILAHGAGAPMDQPFLDRIAAGLAACGLRVIRFEFPYMDARRRTGRRAPPNRRPVLEQTWRAVIEQVAGSNRGKPLFIGGKSMGGRVASHVADSSPVSGLICLGYPFHPAGQPDRLRTEHLEALATPTLILQGERDALGSRSEVEGYRLSSAITVRWLPDGDHSLKPRKRSGHTEEGNLSEAVKAMQRFIASTGS